MDSIKTYRKVKRGESELQFSISRMDDVYLARNGQPDSPHRHDFYTVLLIDEAEGQHFIDFNEYPLSGHEVFFIGPGQVHQLIEEKQTKGYSLLFSDQFLVESNIALSFIQDLHLFNDFGNAPPLSLSADDLQRLWSYAEEMEELYGAESPLSQHAIGALLKLFLIRCNQLCALDEINPQNLESGHSLLRKFKKSLNENYTQWHASSAYAEALHVSTDHLNRVIRSLTGKTTKEHIQSRITTAAKRLLYFSELSNKEIAYELGFSEPANFSAFFKKCTGSSPSQFRSQH